MLWSGVERAFGVGTYFKNRGSVISTQTAFKRSFNLRPSDSVPSRNAFIHWVAAFRATGSTLKQKPSGGPRMLEHPKIFKG